MASEGMLSGGYSHEFLTEFIELYRKQPCLWMVSCRGYKDRLLRHRAYGALVQKLQQVNPIADRDTVIRKINTLRTAFRREYKKVRNSQKLKDDPRYWYRPSLWYYDKLKFVVEQNEEADARRRSSSLPLEEENCPYPNAKDGSMEADGCQEEMMNPSQVGKIEPLSPMPSPSTTPNQFQPVIVETAGNVSCSRRLRCSMTPDICRRKYHHELCQESQAKDQMCDSLHRQYPSCLTADQLDTFGHYVASKLRKTVSRQSNIAEKLIADVLLRASLGTLEENTCLTEKISSSTCLVTSDRC